jgi:RNA polymerase sigma-70 factor (ECF subfamily)
MLANFQNTETVYSQLTDEELVERFRNGDRESLNVLIRNYLPKTQRRVCVMVPECDAEDVKQEIFLSLVGAIGNFKSMSTFATWFHRITMSRIADYYRKATREKDRATEDQPSEIDDPWSKVDDELTVKEALVAMPEKYRKVLLLRFLEDMSFGEIAERLGMKYEAVRSRHRRGMDMLKERLTGTDN